MLTALTIETENQERTPTRKSLYILSLTANSSSDDALKYLHDLISFNHLQPNTLLITVENGGLNSSRAIPPPSLGTRQ